MAHPDGMIGFPLRLLARENYEKLVAAKGVAHVALITGEEKIIPRQARWFSCTVEAMPRDRRMSFVAIDEIQLCADPERGHVFTDRLLHCRGTMETLLLGADTMRPILKSLFPGIKIEMRPRLSSLSHVGHLSLTKLPPRSAIVAFSVPEVYAIADLLRRRRGGCAIVMGQLSPQTRNAQVALFQNREVDYLVATDAIGMGLNMDVDHVALAARHKFDGAHVRTLSPHELAQIFGRAGRGLKDGTFGTTESAPPLEPDLVQQIENHHFAPLKHIVWRNDALDFTSIASLKHCLARPSPHDVMRRGREASDVTTLHALAQLPSVLSWATTAMQVRRLWEVCQIPDFNQLGDTSHARICELIFLSLSTEGRVPHDWFAKQIKRLENMEGDIDALMHRLTAIRLCAYVATKRDWYPRNEPWEKVTRAVETALSDTLHDKLRAKYIDRKAATLSRHLRDSTPGQALSSITTSRHLVIEGHQVGQLDGFGFTLDANLTQEARHLAQKAGRRAVMRHLPTRVQEVENSEDAAFSINLTAATLQWQGEIIARLARGSALLKPEIHLISGELEGQILKERVLSRLKRYLHAHLRQHFAPLYHILEALAPFPEKRALAHLLEEHAGIIPTSALSHGLATALRRDQPVKGLVAGTRALFLRDMLRPKAASLRYMLVALHHGWDLQGWNYQRVSQRRSEGVDAQGVESGFLPSGAVYIRIDMAERWITRLSRATRVKDAALPAGMVAALGVKSSDIPAILKSWRFTFRDGHALAPDHDGPPSPLILHRRRAAKPHQDRARPRNIQDDDPAGPFATLRHWRKK